MGSVYLTDLADVCRNAALTVHEEPGWQTRANGSGGYDPGQPTHIMCHHTASPPTSDGQRDVDYICYGSPVKPISNLYLSRKGEIWVCAAGRTNTNGTGTSTAWNGGVPDNRMNSYAIGIEAANTGTGEPWPTVQQDAYITLCSTLSLHYGIPVHHVRAHHEWTTRKIDPAGPSRYATGTTKWNMNNFRADVALYDPTPEPPPPSSERMIDMFFVIVTNGPESTVKETWLLCDGTQLSHIVDGHAAALMQRVTPTIPQVRPATPEETAGLIRSSRTMTPCPPEWANTAWGALWTSSRN